jgi:hypothetical protein
MTSRLFLACIVAASAMLAGCFEEEKTSVSYTAYNDTDRGIVSIIVNGRGGILNASSHGGGGEMCCVAIPNKWRPGLNATIKWAEDGDWLLDDQGREVIRDGKRVYVPRPYKEKTVEVPRYDNRLGRFNIHFFPNDEVRVIVNMYGPGHPDYPFK